MKSVIKLSAEHVKYNGKTGKMDFDMYEKLRRTNATN